MTQGLYIWSHTAAANASADSSINYSEGQAPSSINDSARSMMARIAEWRDDIMGANNGTGGTSTAYTLSSNQVFDTTAHMAAQHLTIYFHATNGASPTLNVDGLGAFPIVMDGSGTVVPTGTLVAGTPYELAFSNASSRWLLKNFYQLPFIVPVGSMLDFTGSTVPNSNFVFPYGQAISRTTYAAYFSLVSTTYGAGDGATTFNVPDLRGRVTAGKGDMGGVDANLLNSSFFGASGTSLGATGGSQSHALTTGELPSHNHANTLTDPGHTHGNNAITGSTTTGGGGFPAGSNGAATISAAGTGITINNAFAGSGSNHAIVQPTMIVNKILRII